MKETPGNREGGSRGPEAPLELATGRRKPFSEGLGRASGKQQTRAVFPCWQVRLCPGENPYAVKESKGQV